MFYEASNSEAPAPQDSNRLGQSEAAATDAPSHQLRVDWTAIGQMVSHVAHLAVAEHVIQDAAELRRSACRSASS